MCEACGKAYGPPCEYGAVIPAGTCSMRATAVALNYYYSNVVLFTAEAASIVGVAFAVRLRGP